MRFKMNPSHDAIQDLVKKHGLKIEEAQECLAAFDDLLNLDRHKQGIERFNTLGATAGPYLLDQLKACTEEQAELRPHFVADGLGRCLSPEVERELIELTQDTSKPTFVRKHAVAALAHGAEQSTKEFLVMLLLDTMKRQHGDRDVHIYRTLLWTTKHVQDKRTVPALLQILEEQKESRYLDEILPAIDALGEIGDEQAIEPLRRLLDTQLMFLAPSICLALAKLGVQDVPRLIEQAKEKHNTLSKGKRDLTQWQLERFQEAERISQQRAR